MGRSVSVTSAPPFHSTIDVPRNLMEIGINNDVTLWMPFNHIATLLQKIGTGVLVDQTRM